MQASCDGEKARFEFVNALPTRELLGEGVKKLKFSSKNQNTV